MRIGGFLLVSALLVACGPSTKTGGSADSGPTTQTQDLVEISGQAVFDPVELVWRGLPTTYTMTESCTEVASDPGAAVDGGTSPPPCLQGSTIWVEDAIRALDGLCPLATQPLTYDGKFDFSGANKVNVTNTTLALVASVRDALYPLPATCSGMEQDGTPGASPIAFSGYGLGKPPFYDSSNAPAGTLPNTLNLPVYIVSTDFLQLLAKAIGQDFATMVGQGVVIGHVTESDGVTGVAGTQLEYVYGGGTNFPVATTNTYYISADLQSSVGSDSSCSPGPTVTCNANAVTTSSGLFVRLNVGSAEEFTAAVPSSPGVGFEQHLNGSRPGTALEVFFKQCANPPQNPVQEGCPG